MISLVLAAIAAITGAYFLAPAFRMGDVEAAGGGAGPNVLYLRERREQMLTNIIDLDGEYQIGKLSDSDYRRLRNEAIREVAGIEERLEKESVAIGTASMGAAASRARVDAAK